MKIIYGIIIILFPLNSSFAQITYGKIEKKEEVISPISYKPLDSTRTFFEINRMVFYNGKEQDCNSNYSWLGLDGYKLKELRYNNLKRHIGIDFYLPFSDDGIQLVSKNCLILKNSKGEDIYTNKYRAISINKIGNVNTIETDKKEPQDSYYKIINVNSLEDIRSKIEKIPNYYNNNYDYDNFRYDRQEYFIFTAIRKNTQDTIYIPQSTLGDFFTYTPFFVKMKKLYDGKKMISINQSEAIDATTGEKIIVPNLSKWICEINLLKNDNQTKFIFKNDIGQKIVLNNWYSENRTDGNYEPNLWKLYFITEEDYLKRERLNKLKVAERAIELNKEKSLLKLKEKKHREKCISIYGERFGNLIANNQVAIDMSKEMCEISWGKPYDKSVTILEGITIEEWHYSWVKNLHFKNGILVKIEY